MKTVRWLKTSFAVFCLILASACTRKTEKSSQLSITLPAFSGIGQQAVKLNSVGTMSWGVTDPASMAEINCFAIFISGPEPLMRNNVCTNSANSVVATPGIAAGAFKPGQTIQLNVPPGPGRLIQVLGMKVADSAYCVNVNANLDRNHFSQPYILGQAIADLSPNSETRVSINASFSSDLSKQVTDCQGPAFAQMPSATPPSPTVTPFEVDQISANSGAACALSSNGKIKCWGQNNYGEIGAGVAGNFGYLPATAGDNLPFLDIASIGAGVLATKVRMGSSTACAIFSNGELRCWGYNGFGKLGLGSASPSDIGWNTPLFGNWAAVNLSGTGSTPIDVGNGASHTCALMANGTVWCWGYNGSGQLGDGTFTNRLTPVQVAGVASATKLAVGYAHNCVARTGGVQCWGRGTEGQLGNNTTSNSGNAVYVSSITSAIAVTTGNSFNGNYSCAVKSGGDAYCWGDNSQYSLGDGTSNSSNVPVAVTGLATGVTKISGGNGHACAVKAGALYCWGAGNTGQIGQDSTATATTPTVVLGMSSGVTDVTTGDVFTCAKMGNQAKCFGYGVYGATLQGDAISLGDDPGEMSALPYLQLGNQ
jgi:alpha-tubulin suppressor-like RCC1 family protein